MNTLTKTVLCLAIGVASAAQAQQVVVIEAQRDVVDPSVLIGEDSGSAYFASLPLGPGVDRTQVIAELDQARASGQLAALVSEDSGSAWLERTASGMRTARFDVGPELAARSALHHASAASEVQTK